jgi:hypothetical protein
MKDITVTERRIVMVLGDFIFQFIVYGVPLLIILLIILFVQRSKKRKKVNR